MFWLRNKKIIFSYVLLSGVLKITFLWVFKGSVSMRCFYLNTDRISFLRNKEIGNLDGYTLSRGIKDIFLQLNVLWMITESFPQEVFLQYYYAIVSQIISPVLSLIYPLSLTIFHVNSEGCDHFLHLAYLNA